MAKFYQTHRGEIVNIDMISAITPITRGDLYNRENDLSLLGNHLVNKYLDDDEKRKLGGHSHDGIAWYWDANKIIKPNEKIMYAIHTNCPSGGINNNHYQIYIYPAEMKNLIGCLDFIDYK